MNVRTWQSEDVAEKIVLLLIGGIFFLLYFSHAIFLGQDSFILIHDNLDQINRFGAIIDGVVKTSSFQIDKKLYSIFGVFYGFSLNEFLYRLVSVVSFYYLLKNYASRITSVPSCILLFIAIAFVSLPFWPQGNLSVAGVPLVGLCLFNLYNRQGVMLSLIILAILPFYSSLILSGAFILFVLLFVFLYLFMRRDLPSLLVYGGVALLGGYLIANYELIVDEFGGKHEESIRAAILVSQLKSYDFIGAMKVAAFHFLNSQYHAHSFHKFIILPTSFCLWIYLSSKEGMWRVLRSFGAIACYLILSSLVYGLYYYRPLQLYYEQFHFGFNYSRFYFLSPAGWYFLWGGLLIRAYSHVSNKRSMGIAIVVMALMQAGINMKNYTYKGFVAKPTFKQFFSVDQFTEIKEAIKINSGDKVGCIGFFPVVANYSGLETVGSYRSIYRLSFKNDFYEVIQGELEGNDAIRDYYKFWGARAYLFDDLIGKKYSDQQYIQSHITSIHSELNMSKLKDMKTKYLLSSAQIANADELNITEVMRSLDLDYYYRLYLYEIN